MIDQSWVEKQVLSMNLGEIKVWCRRKRLRFTRQQIVLYVMALAQQQPGFDVSVISPPHPKQKWQLTPEQQQQYKKRWSIEEVYRQLKEPFGPYKLTMRGVRRRALREARVAIATLAWNMQHT